MAEKNFSALKKRIITGGLLIFFVAFLWSIGRYGILILVSLLSIIGQWEFCNFFLEKGKIKERVFAVCLGLLYVFIACFHAHSLSNIVFIAIFLLIALFTLLDFSQETALRNMKNAGIILASFLYLPVIYSVLLSCTPLQQVMIVCIPIVSDTVAYFAGVKFGKRKIWEAVSPKKSVEGSLAGLIGAIIVVLCFGLLANTFHTKSIYLLLFFGLFIGIMTQLGDFFESALKRSVNVKDSGAILPGHGGVLDRTDSLIFTIASFEICLVCVRHF